MAIEVYFQFEQAVFEQNVLFPFPLVTAKRIGDLFDKKRCGSNKIFLTYNITHQKKRTECSERKKRRGPNKKKIREIKSGS